MKEKEELLFLKKKKQKNFCSGGVGGSVPIKPNRRLGLIGTPAPTPPEQKFFGSFFQKRTSSFLVSF
jgi:hypothetical protein